MKLTREQSQYVFDYCGDLLCVVLEMRAKGVKTGLCFYSSHIPTFKPLSCEPLVKDYLYSRLSITRRILMFLADETMWWHENDTNSRIWFLIKTMKHLKKKYKL